MDRRKMLAGWDKAAKKQMERRAKREQPRKQPTCTLTELGEMAERQRAVMLENIGQRPSFKANLTGAEFDLLLAWERLPYQVNETVFVWLCLCACGDSCEVAANALLQRRKRDCGCRKKGRHYTRKHRRKEKRREERRKTRQFAECEQIFDKKAA
jgi:hypothetical protein